MVKCAIFDADGTLLDSMPMWRDITYEYPDSKGISVPEGLHKTMNRMSLEQCAALYRQLGVPGSAAEVEGELAAWALMGYRERVGEKPRAGDFLKLLHKNGIKIAVATASNEEGVRAALDRLNMLPFVDCLFTCAQVGKSKDEPDIFLRCAEEFGAASRECVVFEDSFYALRTAKAAGFPTVAVEDGISGDGGVEEETPAGIAALADRYIKSYGELIEELTPSEDDFPGALSQSLGK